MEKKLIAAIISFLIAGTAHDTQGAAETTEHLKTLSEHLTMLGGSLTLAPLSDETLEKMAKAADVVAETAFNETVTKAREIALKKSAGGVDTALLIIDVQHDFVELPIEDRDGKIVASQGSLAVKGTGKDYINACNFALSKLRPHALIIFTQDWHPPYHISFLSRAQQQTPELIKEDGLLKFITSPYTHERQYQWPDHCKQEDNKPTFGADIAMNHFMYDISVKKGMKLNFDSYSGFEDDGKGLTAMEAVLAVCDRTKLIVYGIATDFCVQATVLHALERKASRKYTAVHVITNLCRGVNKELSLAAFRNMAKNGAVLHWVSNLTASGAIPLNEIQTVLQATEPKLNIQESKDIAQFLQTINS